MSEQNLLIIVLTQHPNLGSLLIPYHATKSDDGVISIEEQTTAASLKSSSLSDAEKEIVRISQSFSDKNLMKSYSQEKVVSVFLRKLTEKTIKEQIRPFIEKQLYQMADLIRIHHLPLYNKEAGKRQLYEHSRFNVGKEFTQANFRFELTEESFRYSASCYQDDQPVSLFKQKPVVVLSSSPACILLRSDMLLFEEMKAARVLPFIDRTFVTVNASNAAKYLEIITLPIVERYESSVSGFEMIEETPICKAELHVEQSDSEQAAINICFYYNEHCFQLEDPTRSKYARLTQMEGRFVIHYFTRNKEWENQCVKMLVKSGLKWADQSRFVLKDGNSSRTLSDWTTKNQAMCEEGFIRQ